MELLRFSAFWCGAILFGSIQLEEAGELNFVTSRKVDKSCGCVLSQLRRERSVSERYKVTNCLLLGKYFKLYSLFMHVFYMFL